MEISLDNPKSIFRILKEGFKLYSQHFLKLSRVMVYPILAHVIGISFIFLVTFGLPEILPEKITLNHGKIIAFIIIIATLPGFALFLNGFWAYLVAMISLNRFVKALVEKDDTVTIKICNEYVNNRKKPYAYVLCLMMLLWIVGFILTLIPTFLSFIFPFWIVMILVIIFGFISLLLVLCLSVYFSLSFQVFAFEDVSVIDVFKRSFELIDNNFFRTLLLLIILYIITGIIFPFSIHITCEIIGIVKVLSGLISWVINILLTQISTMGTIYATSIYSCINKIFVFVENPAYEISKTIIILTIDGIVTAGMLPLGTICFTLLYFDINNRKNGK